MYSALSLQVTFNMTSLIAYNPRNEFHSVPQTNINIKG